MKKNYFSYLNFNKLKKSAALLMVSAGMSFNLIAQPVLVSSNLQAGISFDAYSLSGINASSVMASNGANVTWDLSGVTLGTPAATIDFMTAAATGYSSTYPSANFALKLTAGANFKYNLSVVTTTVMEDTAINVGTGGLQTFINNRTTLVFPFTYGLTLSDTYQKTGQSATSVTHNYDAYGTLIVGIDTLHNLVRDMTTDNGVSTTSAIWWNVSPLYPVLQLSNTGATFLKPKIITGINTSLVNNCHLNIYPNPATDNLTIANIAGKTTLRIYDTLGKLVIEKETESNTTIDTSQLTQGVYTLVAENNKGRVFNKVVITK